MLHAEPLYSGHTGRLCTELLAVCSRLINKGEILEWLERALVSHPTLLTLEDFVCPRGSEWGFDAATIQMACALATHFDRIAGNTRYSYAFSFLSL
jgi:hypothetical protein